MGYDDSGSLVTIREGSNELTCLADEPGDTRFHVACYHNSLEPYMARGRELRAEGIRGQESFDIRHEEAEAGALSMPTAPAAVYNVMADVDSFDRSEGERRTIRTLHSLRHAGKHGHPGATRSSRWALDHEGGHSVGAYHDFSGSSRIADICRARSRLGPVPTLSKLLWQPGGE